jgi:hypothetical protein
MLAASIEGMKMKRAIAILALLLFSTASARLQEHAPTVEVCRADAAVWTNVHAETDYYNAELERTTNGVPNRTEMEKLPIIEVRARSREMFQCEDVDPARKESYLDAGRFYHNVQADRWYEFLLRHNLIDQFEQDDAAGKR